MQLLQLFSDMNITSSEHFKNTPLHLAPKILLVPAVQAEGLRGQLSRMHWVWGAQPSQGAGCFGHAAFQGAESPGGAAPEDVGRWEL